MDRVEQIPCGIHVHRAVVAIGNAYQERFFHSPNTVGCGDN
jgi:hypothetical protein